MSITSSGPTSSSAGDSQAGGKPGDIWNATGTFTSDLASSNNTVSFINTSTDTSESQYLLGVFEGKFTVPSTDIIYGVQVVVEGTAQSGRGSVITDVSAQLFDNKTDITLGNSSSNIAAGTTIPATGISGAGSQTYGGLGNIWGASRSWLNAALFNSGTPVFGITYQRDAGDAEVYVDYITMKIWYGPRTAALMASDFL